VAVAEFRLSAESRKAGEPNRLARPFRRVKKHDCEMEMENFMVSPQLLCPICNGKYF
jgi:hypothetical protein